MHKYTYIQNIHTYIIHNDTICPWLYMNINSNMCIYIYIYTCVCAYMYTVYVCMIVCHIFVWISSPFLFQELKTDGQDQFGLKIFIDALLVKFEEHLDSGHMTWRIPRQEPLSTSEAEGVRIEFVGLFHHWNLASNSKH